MITLYLDQKETSWYRRKYQLTEEEYQKYVELGPDYLALITDLKDFWDPYDEETVDCSIESMEPGDNNGEATLELILENKGKETILYKNA